MKTPWYETSPGALMALLLTRSFVWCDLYSITLSSGVLRYTSGQIDVKVPGFPPNWLAGRVLIDPERMSSAGHWKTGTGVDTWQVALSPRPYDPTSGVTSPDTINGQPWLASAVAGVFDGADLQVDRVFFPLWPDPTQPPPATISPTGALTVFKGLIAGVDPSRSVAALTAVSYLTLLEVNVPRHLWQAGCRYTLFDSGCGLSSAGFAQVGTVTPGSSQNVINSAIAAPPGSGTYALGRIVMTSGKNLGFARGVRSWTPGALTLIAPFYFPIAVGDAFVAYPGCDKTQGTCTAFANLANFGGQPYIPAATTAL